VSATQANDSRDGNADVRTPGASRIPAGSTYMSIAPRAGA
jgi:hypothetical protein